MATVEQCEAAFNQLADRVATVSSAGRNTAPFDRTLSCTINDLSLIFAARLHDGKLLDIHQTTDPAAQVRMAMTSDDLLKLVDGELKMGAAWASGRIKVDASIMDLLKLRSIF
jgi:hypothetical protein